MCKQTVGWKGGNVKGGRGINKSEDRGSTEARDAAGREPAGTTEAKAAAGLKSDKPAKLSDRIKTTARELRSIWEEPVVRLLPAHLAFFTVLSIAPIMIIVYFGAQTFSLPIESIIQPLQAALPQAVSDILSPTEHTASGLSIGIWLIVAFFIGSNGLNSVIVGSNSLYGFESATYVVRRVRAFFLTLLLIILVLLGIAIIGLGSYLLDILPDNYQFLVSSVRWVLVGLLAFITVKYLYMVTPRIHIHSRFTNVGSLVTVIGWLLATAAYTFYYNHFSNYDQYYGSLTNIIVLMIWVYILATVFVIGLIINVYQFRKDPEIPNYHLHKDVELIKAEVKELIERAEEHFEGESHARGEDEGVSRSRDEDEGEARVNDKDRHPSSGCIEPQGDKGEG